MKQFTHTYKSKTSTYNVPSKWNDIKTMKVLTGFVKLQNRKFPEKRFLINCLKLFSGIPWRKVWLMDKGDVALICQSMKFLAGKCLFNQQLMPVIKVKRKTFTGVQSGLMDFTFEDFFRITERYFRLLSETQNPAYLNLLIAGLYKNDMEIEDRARVLKHLSVTKKQAVLLFYTGCRNYIQNRFPVLFPLEPDEAPQQKLNDLSYLEFLNSLNNEDITRNEKIKQTPLYEALVYISSLIVKSLNTKKNV